jgi:putative flippase GtrA
MIHVAAPRAQFAPYVVAGAANTALTYALLVVAMRWIGYLGAYTIVYAVGIAFGYWLQSRFVFRVPLAWRVAVRFPLVYLVQYAFGFAMLWLLVDAAHVESDVAALIVVIANVPLGFLLSRLLLAQSRLHHRSAPTERSTEHTGSRL